MHDQEAYAHWGVCIEDFCKEFPDVPEGDHEASTEAQRRERR